MAYIPTVFQQMWATNKLGLSHHHSVYKNYRAFPAFFDCLFGGEFC